MGRAYGLSVILLAIIASGVAALGQTPSKMGQDDIAKTVSVMDHVWLDAAHDHGAEHARHRHVADVAAAARKQAFVFQSLDADAQNWCRHYRGRLRGAVGITRG